METLIYLNSYPVKDVLNKLLQDKSTGKNIVFATDNYRLNYGTGYSEYSYMTVQTVRGFASCNIQPRVYKSAYEQSERTRKKAEVFTPSWLVNKMNNFCDAEWFGRENVFNRENGTSWDITLAPIEFPRGKRWQGYVDSRRLEITCGEAPYIASRYDTTTGEIIDVERRIGILDRKLRVVGENTATEEEWLKWAVRAVQSVYGYEFQGDNLLIARINVLSTFCDYLENEWHRQATNSELSTVANIIAWNFWQMDGLEGIAPFGTEHEEWIQFSLMEKIAEAKDIKCSVYDWRAKRPMPFEKLEERGKGMKFDYVIGNPPYQDDTLGDNATFAPPVYNLFLEESYKIADKVEMIHPARFLFNAGSTPKAWNKKMLADEHLKILFYEQNSAKVFANTDIKGGVVVSYHNVNENYGAIEVFTPYDELNSVMKKVYSRKDFKSFSNIVITRTAYRLTDKMHQDFPQAINQLSKGHAYDMSTNIFERLPQIFLDDKPDDTYIKILGRTNNERVYKYVKKEYVCEVLNLDKWKLFIPKASGVGELGEVISTPVITEPSVGHTESFLSIGIFDTKIETENCLKYIKTKFTRTLLGVLKITQDITPEKWKYVPLQDFTENSDIDWNKSIPEIDKQLYAKYGLSKDEINFIETNVKEME